MAYLHAAGLPLRRLGIPFSCDAGVGMMPAMQGGGVLGTGFFSDSVGLLPTFVISGLVIVGIGTAGLFSRRMVALGISKL